MIVESAQHFQILLLEEPHSVNQSSMKFRIIHQEFTTFSMYFKCTALYAK